MPVPMTAFQPVRAVRLPRGGAVLLSGRECRTAWLQLVPAAAPTSTAHIRGHRSDFARGHRSCESSINADQVMRYSVVA